MSEDGFRAAFGAALDRQLRARNVRRRYLARALDVSEAYVSAVANGKKPASAALANRIGTALDLTQEETEELHRAAAVGRGYKIKLPATK